LNRLRQFLQLFPRLFETPPLTARRWKLAFAVAVIVDLLQMLLGPIGWLFLDEGLDVVAMVLTWRLLGFHPLLLPTFILEFLPVTDLAPTWIGCVAIVVALRRREHPSVPPPPAQTGRVFDV